MTFDTDSIIFATDYKNLMYLDNNIFQEREYPHYLESTSFQDVVANVMKHDKAEEFSKNIHLPLKAINDYLEGGYHECNVLTAFEEAMSGNYDKASSTLDKIDYYVFDNSWANALNYSLLTLMAFEEGDSHFKENSLMP